MGEVKKKSKNYVDYDYENTYDRQIKKMDEALIDEWLKLKNKCIYRTKEITAGVIKEIETYPVFSRAELKSNGAKKKNRDAQNNLNDKNAKKRAIRLINANFTDKDYWVTVSYDDEHLPKNIDEAIKNIKNYIRRINYRKEKLGLEKLKYIYITEQEDGKDGTRYHHHLVMDGNLTMDDLESLWKLGGRNCFRRLRADESGYTGIGKYITKGSKGMKRWCSSTNLKQPKESINHYKFKKKRVQRMVRHRDSIKSEMEKTYPDYIFVSSEVRYNEQNSMFYIYTTLRKKVGAKKE